MTNEDRFSQRFTNGTFMFGGTASSALRTNEKSQIVTQTNAFVIESMDDFPDSVSGVITLPDGVYSINAILITSDRFVIPDGGAVTFVGEEGFTQGFVYTGSGDFFTANDFVVFSINQIFLSTPLGTIFDITPASASTAGLFLDTMSIVDTDTLGTISNIDTVSIINVGFLDIGQGLVLNDINTFAMLFSQFKGWKNETSTMFTFDGVFDILSIAVIFFEVMSNETALDIKTTSTVNNGIVSSSGFDISSGGIALSPTGKDQSDINFRYSGNTNVPDSTTSGYTSFQGNATVTVISVINTPVKILATYVEDATVTERLIFDATGKITYIGLEDKAITVNASFKVDPAVPAIKDFAIYVYKNGVQVAQTKASSASAKGTQITLFGLIPMVTNDFIELFIENETDATNVTAIDGSVKIG